MSAATTSTREEDTAAVLCELASRTAAVKATPRPPAWQPWAVREHDDQVKYGPRYSPSAWFGAVTEAQRIRYLRTIHRLDQAGLVIPTKTGRRMTHVRLTKAGARAAAELRNATAAPAAGRTGDRDG